MIPKAKHRTRRGSDEASLPPTVSENSAADQKIFRTIISNWADLFDASATRSHWARSRASLRQRVLRAPTVWYGAGNRLKRRDITAPPGWPLGRSASAGLAHRSDRRVASCGGSRASEPRAVSSDLLHAAD